MTLARRPCATFLASGGFGREGPRAAVLSEPDFRVPYWVQMFRGRTLDLGSEAWGEQVNSPELP